MNNKDLAKKAAEEWIAIGLIHNIHSVKRMTTNKFCTIYGIETDIPKIDAPGWRFNL